MAKPALVRLLILSILLVAAVVAAAGILLMRQTSAPGSPASSTNEPPTAPAASHEDGPPTPPGTASSTPEATEVVEITPVPDVAQSSAWWLRPDHKYGIHLLLDDDRNHWLPEVWPQHLQAARRFAGEGGYVVQLIRLDDLDVERWQYFMDLCAEQHLIPIVRLAGAFDHVNKWWIAPPKDADSEGYTAVAARIRDFLGGLRWPAEPRYAIVGNEPNRGDEWSNRPDPAEYARFLLDVGQALHTIGIRVLAPALDLYAPHTNGQLIGQYRYFDAESFLDGMAAAEPRAFDVIDVWAAHAYPLDPFRFDPSRQTFQIDYAHGATNPDHLDPPDGMYNRGVNSYRWELWKASQIAGLRFSQIPVFITETGWRHAPTQDPEARDSVHAEISIETQSAYLDLAFNGNKGHYPGLPETGWTPWNDDPQVLAVVLFALGGYPKDWGHTNWVLLDQEGQVIGTYDLHLADRH
jgi:hypothetical protein